jgi:hypothetical protein
MTHRDRFNRAVDRFQHERAVFLSGIERLTQIELNYQPTRHSWSIGQLAHHVALAESVWFGYIKSLLGKGSRDNGATLRVSLQEVPFSARMIPDFVLKSPFVIAPLSFMVNMLPRPLYSMLFAVPIFKFDAGARMQPRVGLTRTQILKILSDTRKTTMDLINPVADWDLSRFRLNHPLVGEQNVYGILELIASHDQRHTSQVESIKKTSDYPRVHSATAGS